MKQTQLKILENDKYIQIKRENIHYALVMVIGQLTNYLEGVYLTLYFMLKQTKYTDRLNI